MQLVFDGRAWRVQRPDGTLTNGRFHTRTAAQQWLDTERERFERGRALAHPQLEVRSANYAADNERRCSA